MFSHSRIAPYHKLKKRKNDMPPRPLENSAIHPFEIARESSTLQACQTRQDPAPQKAKPSPVTTPPPTASTPSRPSSRTSSARPVLSPPKCRLARPPRRRLRRLQSDGCGGNIHAVCIKNYRNCQTNLICQVKEASTTEAGCSCPARSREPLGDPIALPVRRKSEGELAEGRAPSGQAPPRYGLKGNHRHPVPSSSNPPL